MQSSALPLASDNNTPPGPSHWPCHVSRFRTLRRKTCRDPACAPRVAIRVQDIGPPTIDSFTRAKLATVYRLRDREANRKRERFFSIEPVKVPLPGLEKLAIDGGHRDGSSPRPVTAPALLSPQSPPGVPRAFREHPGERVM